MLSNFLIKDSHNCILKADFCHESKLILDIVMILLTLYQDTSEPWLESIYTFWKCGSGIFRSLISLEFMWIYNKISIQRWYVKKVWFCRISRCWRVFTFIMVSPKTYYLVISFDVIFKGLKSLQYKGHTETRPRFKFSSEGLLDESKCVTRTLYFLIC